MAVVFWVINHVDSGYGVDVQLNAKEKRARTFKIMKVCPSVVEKYILRIFTLLS